MRLGGLQFLRVGVTEKLQPVDFTLCVLNLSKLYMGVGLGGGAQNLCAPPISGGLVTPLLCICVYIHLSIHPSLYVLNQHQMERNLN